MSRVVGIDLGTTFSVVAVMEGGEATVVPNAEGNRLTPSVVAFTKSGERLVGQLARRQAVLNPQNTVGSIKRFMGRRYEDVAAEALRVPYKVVAGPAGDARVFLPATNREYTPQEISAMVLQKLKADVERYLSERVDQAVITVPAYFNDSQRQATKDAGKIAGMDVLRIINEPTAASLAYGLERQKLETILVFDLGGGTFDVSVLEVGEGVFDVKSTAGDTHLGGDDYDQALADWIAAEFKRDQGVELREDRQALQRLLEAAERAKIELSSVVQTEVNLPFITADASGPKHLQLTITRATFEELTADLTERCIGPFKRALEDAKLRADQIDEVVLVGGASRMPAVGQLVRRLLDGKEPHQGVNPDEVVAIGAAVQAGVLTGDVHNVVLLDVTPLSLGVETQGGVMTTLIERNTTIPTRKSEVFTTAADSQPAVDIHVLQGEREMARDNVTLGRFRLDGLPPAPRGAPQVEVAFDIDANGILNVWAKDMASGREQRITITASTNLSRDQIDRMVAEAALHAAEDRVIREGIETRNQADSLVYATEKSLREVGDRLAGADRDAIERALDACREALATDDVGRIRVAAEELGRVGMALSAEDVAGTFNAEDAEERGGRRGGEDGRGGDGVDRLGRRGSGDGQGNGRGSGEDGEREAEGVVEGEWREG